MKKSIVIRNVDQISIAILNHWHVKTVTDISPLLFMTDLINSYHCFQNMFHFLSVYNGPTSILSDISITLRKLHEFIFEGYFWKVQILARDTFETCRRRHRIDIFFEMLLRRLKDVTKKVISFYLFLRGFWDVCLNGDLIEISQRHLIPAGLYV